MKAISTMNAMTSCMKTTITPLYTLVHETYNKILAHRIHLDGKMIHYGTKIVYTYVSIPKSNKRFLWNYTPLP